MRESLLGTYDIFMGRSSQRDSQVVTTLTVLSAILLPAVVIAGIMGMNFKQPFFDDPSNFWVALALMATLAIGVLAVARWRHWV
jgi:magnesium transporter